MEKGRERGGMVPARPLIRIYLKLLLMAMLWGGTFIAGRLLSGHVGPFSAAFLRFAIASLFLLSITWKVEGRLPLPAAHQVVPVILLGLTGILLYNFCFFSGLKYIEAGRASVIVANNPIFIALFSALFFKERLTPVKCAGILLSVFGAVFVITRGAVGDLFQAGFGPGEGFILGCVFSWVAYSLIGKALMNALSPLLSVTYSVAAGTLLLLVPALMEGLAGHLFSYTPREWLCLFYLGFCGTVVGYMLYYQGIEAIGPTRAGLFINFVPLSGVLLGFLFLGEPLTASLLLGLALVVGGVYLTNRRPGRDRGMKESRRSGRASRPASVSAFGQAVNPEEKHGAGHGD